MFPDSKTPTASRGCEPISELALLAFLRRDLRMYSMKLRTHPENVSAFSEIAYSSSVRNAPSAIPVRSGNPRRSLWVGNSSSFFVPDYPLEEAPS